MHPLKVKTGETVIGVLFSFKKKKKKKKIIEKETCVKIMK